MPTKVKQFYAPYTDWEDYQNGMYYLPEGSNAEEMAQSAIALLCNGEAFFQACLKLFSRWSIASRVNMTNVNQNRRAWLGQAACCFVHKVPEIVTREAWTMLSDDQRRKANDVADRAITWYEATHFNVRRDVAQARIRKRHPRRSASKTDATAKGPIVESRGRRVAKKRSPYEKFGVQ